MKIEPTKKVTNPGYPTLDQVQKYSAKSSVTKIAAVTALATAMTLTCACGDDSHSGKGHLSKTIAAGFKGTEETTEYVLDGEVACTNETDPTYELMGEEPLVTDYTISGDVAVMTDETDYDLDGEEDVVVSLELSGAVSAEAPYEGN